MLETADHARHNPILAAWCGSLFINSPLAASPGSALRGSSFPRNLLLSKPIPCLTLEERVAYLYDREYFPTGAFTENHHEQLEHLNFHYFLGYAHN